MADALYSRDGDVFQPSGYVRGPWSFDHCHGGPPAGLLTSEILSANPDMGMTRVAVDIPGPIPIAPVAIDITILRPGRKIRHVQATMTGVDGTPYASATAWLMRIDEKVVAQTKRAGEVPPPPENGREVVLEFWGDEHDFSEAVDMVGVEGAPFSGGAATVWTNLKIPLLAGEQTNPYAFAATMADFQNGISALAPFTELLCVNTDVTVYFGRKPAGKWLALRSSTNSSGLGLGMSDSLLYDASGFVGTANQSIFFDSLIRREPEPES